MMAEEYMYREEEEAQDLSIEEEIRECDAVNHPSHYDSLSAKYSIECIDAMVAAFGEEAVADFCVCNAFKYLWRCSSKGKNQDIKKAQWYLNKYLELGGCD